DRYVIDEQDNEIINGLSIEDENSFIFSINAFGEMKTKGYIRRDSRNIPVTSTRRSRQTRSSI
ncbi:MAG: hypothetical protein J6D10_12370, partial [Clostridia bacterium]|nr:hypothetical protein [Clostridia bacterium]